MIGLTKGSGMLYQTSDPGASLKHTGKGEGSLPGERLRGNIGLPLKRPWQVYRPSKVRCSLSRVAMARVPTPTLESQSAG